jgi:methyltransferase (TIGR00027 family)
VFEMSGAAAGCDRVVVAADLADDWARAMLSAGFEPVRPTVWLAEGLLFYLPDRLVRTVLRDITRLSLTGSRLGFDMPNRAVLWSPWTKPWVEMQAAAGAPWLGTMDDPAAELAALGWTAVVTQPGEGDSGHGRWTLPVLPAAASELPHSWYVTAVRGA